MATQTAPQSVFETASRSDLAEYARYVLYVIDYADSAELVGLGDFLECEKQWRDWDSHNLYLHSGRGLAINVKFYGTIPQIEGWSELSETHQQSISETFTEMWWEDAEEIAKQNGFTVSSAGRSGGWLLIGTKDAPRGRFTIIDFDRDDQPWLRLAEYGIEDFEELADTMDALKRHRDAVSDDFVDLVKFNISETS